MKNIEFPNNSTNKEDLRRKNCRHSAARVQYIICMFVRGLSYVRQGLPIFFLTFVVAEYVHHFILIQLEQTDHLTFAEIFISTVSLTNVRPSVDWVKIFLPLTFV